MKVRTFKTKKSKKFFFSFLDDDGQTILKSIPFDSKPERDKAKMDALAQIAKRVPFKDKNEGGKFGFSYVSGSKVILSSQEGWSSQNDCNNAKESLYNIGLQLLKEAEQEESDAPINDKVEKTKDSYKTDGSTDDYKPLSFYQENGGNTQDGFDSFEKDGEFYFSYRKNGKIHLISEGYSSAKSRDNGIASVDKNRVIAERYDRKKHRKNNKFYFDLKAGNHQEIATSAWYGSEQEINNAINLLQSKGNTGANAGNTNVGNEGANFIARTGDATTTTSNIAVPTYQAPEPNEDADKPKKKRKKRTTPKKAKGEKVILKTGEYPINDVKWQIFQSGGNKRYYFILRDKNDKSVFFNSNVKGYDTEADAQAGLDTAMSFSPSDANYEVKIAKNGKYYFYVQNEKKENVGKSFFYNTEEDLRNSIARFCSRRSDNGSSR
jgi:uncharacterized protein YegP (UPF0339 family)